MADVNTKSLVGNFLELLGEWEYNIPLTTQWAVSIQPDAGNNLFNIIANYTQIDVNGFYIPASIQQILLSEKANPKIDELGLYYAQSVVLPSESFSRVSVGMDNMAGYLKGIVGGDRAGMDSRVLNINFLETNVDFSGGLIRPWVIAAAYKGLINLGNSNSIKCEITIREFTGKSLNQNKPLRKEHKFKGCVPTDVSDKTLSYDQEQVRIDSVNWLYEEYTYKILT